MKTMTARYPGKCNACSEPISPGDSIRYAGRGQTFHEACPAVQTAPPKSYRSTRRGFSTFGKPRGGRCEDAPCCGCC